MGFVGQILIKLEMHFIQGSLQLLLWCFLGNNLCKHTGGDSVTTYAHLTCGGLCGMEVWKLIGAICDMRSNMPTRMIDHHVLTVSVIPPIHRSNNIYIYIYICILNKLIHSLATMCNVAGRRDCWIEMITSWRAYGLHEYLLKDSLIILWILF